MILIKKMFNERKNKRNGTMKINTSYQYLLDEVIKVFLDKYEYFKLNDEFRDLIKENDEIFSEKPLIPELIKKNKLFNKNKCFYEANQNEINYFPRYEFKLNENKLNNAKEKTPTNICSNSDVMKNIFLNAGIDDIKELLKGGNSEFNQEEDNSIFNLINLNTVWIMNINGIVAKFNSFELFEFMTINILCNNQKLDDYIIYNKQVDRSFKGGYLYIYLKKYLPLIISCNNYNEYNYNNSYNKLDKFKINNVFNNMDNINNNNNQINQLNYSIQNFMNLEVENSNLNNYNS